MKKNRLSSAARRREAFTGLLFISPWLIGLCVFFAFPIFRSLQLSFVNVINMTNYTVEWAGMSHYKEIIQTDTWYVKHFLTKCGEMLYQTPLINVFSIFIAILLNRKFRGRTLFRVVFFLPVILGSGFIMSQLVSQGVQGEAMETAQNVLLPMEIKIFLGEKATKFVTDFLNIISSVLWKCGVQIIIYLSALQSIAPSLYEAARVDSATEWEMFWLITFPMMTPHILLNLVYTVVDSFVGADDLLFKHIQNIAFQNSQFENASAMSWLFFVWAILFVGIIFIIMRPFVNRVKE